MGNYICKLSMTLPFICFIAVFSCTPTPPLTVVSYGNGAYHQSQVTVFVEPFQEELGIPINSITWKANYRDLENMLAKNRVDWDVVEVTDAQFKRGIKDRIFEELSGLPPTGDFLPGTRSRYGVANVYWGTVIAYNGSKYQASQIPMSWKDFWDVERFPGPRALCDDPRGNLEFALLADGVPRERLYPIDVERAFRKLDELKSHIKYWWTDGSKPIELLTSDSVQLTSIWNGRAFAARKRGLAVAFSWEGAALERDWWVILRGSKNVEAASQFIAFASNAGRLADQAQRIGYGPVNLDALPLIPEDVRRELPTFPLNWEKAFVISSEWWSANEQTVWDRWNSWRRD